MKSYNSNVQVWKNSDGDFCLYFPESGSFYWGFSYTRDAQDIWLVLDVYDDGYTPENLAKIILGEGDEYDLDAYEGQFEAYQDALENGELYSFLIEDVIDDDMIVTTEPDIKRVCGMLIGDILD